MSYRTRNPYMTINHGLIGGTRESQGRYLCISSNSLNANISQKIFTFNNFDEMQDNPYTRWEDNLFNMWNTAQINIVVGEYALETKKDKKYPSLKRFTGGDEFDLNFQGLIDSWNALLDFDIKNWFENQPFNPHEYWNIKEIKSRPTGTRWVAQLKSSEELVYVGWSGDDHELYLSFNLRVTANEINLWSRDVGDEQYGLRYTIRKLEKIPIIKKAMK
jgi:hypothetical protein